MIDAQMKKGVLELCVLTLLEKKDHYGYELVSIISKNIEISEGTIYPLLKRLKDSGYLTTFLVESKEGPSRKYYKITPEGKKYNKDLTTEWSSFSKNINMILKR